MQVAKEIEKLKLTMQDLITNNAEQGCMLFASNQQRLTAQLTNTEKQQQPQSTVEQIVTSTKQLDKQEEDVLYTQNIAWPWTGGRKGVPITMQEVSQEERVAQAVNLYINYVREAEARGHIVIICETNAVNNIFVHNWGQLVRNGLGHGVVDHRNYRAKTLHEVRMANDKDLCATPKTRPGPISGFLSQRAQKIAVRMVEVYID